jgi:caffeoyl-CoA O-methyltransferase
MGETPKSIQMTTALHAYLVSHGTPPDAIQRALIDETRVLGNISVPS